jgi:hypothetical protein
MKFNEGDILVNKAEPDYKVIIDEIYKGSYFVNMTYRNAKGEWRHCGKGTRYNTDKLENEFTLFVPKKTQVEVAKEVENVQQ